MDIAQRVAKAIADSYGWKDHTKFEKEADAAIEAAGVKELVEALEGFIDSVEYYGCGWTFRGDIKAASAALAKYRGEK